MNKLLRATMVALAGGAFVAVVAFAAVCGVLIALLARPPSGARWDAEDA
jgi:hypothetical protein